jgi:tetratricopeptide (TPR) repeat protein
MMHLALVVTALAAASSQPAPGSIAIEASAPAPDAAAPTSQPAGDVPAASSRPEATPFVDGLAGFSLEYGDHLFRDGDYYRAISEYRRYLYLTRGLGEQAQRVALAIGEAYLRGRQLEAAAAQFESVARRTVGTQRVAALISAGRAAVLDDKPLLASRWLSQAREEAGDDRALAAEALFLLGWARLGERDWDAARAAFDEVAGGGGPRASSAGAIVAQLDGRGALEQKNPLLAGALSLIPGLGHMYLGQWAVGIAALTWNALFVFATGWSIYSGEWGVAAVLAVFELSWFSGTMFGALNGAFRHNQDVLANWQDEIVGGQGRSRELDDVAGAPGRPGALERLVPGLASGG